MLILLPPSEGKFAPSRGKPLDLEALSNGSLTQARQQILTALIELCSGDEQTARKTLGLTPGLAAEVLRNANLPQAPTAAASRIYTGVLYDALGLDTLSPGARRRAASRLLVTSSLFGIVKISDRIPAYRLSGDVTLPGLGTVSSLWRAPLEEVLAPVARSQLVVDLRSGMYANFWRPKPADARRVVTIRVLQEVSGTRTVVSHFNKATKGRIVRAILEDGRNPGTPAAFVRLLQSLGWMVEPTPRIPNGFDVIVTET